MVYGKFQNTHQKRTLWLHHWIMAAIAMIGLLIANIDSVFVWGALTGIALEGLGRKNWSISRK